MDEASCIAYTHKVLSKRGYVCIKYNDGSTSGILDSTINGNGKTIHVESKYFVCSRHLVRETNPSTGFNTLSVSARRFIKKDRMTQMVLACQLEKVCLAEYWLYLEYEGKLYLARLSPKAVWESYRVDQQMTFKVEKAEECRNSFHL